MLDRATPRTGDLRSTLLTIVPGLVLAAAATAVAMLVHRGVHALSPLSVAVVLGVVVANTYGPRPEIFPGVRFAGRKLLRVAVVLLGFQLSLGQLRSLGASGLVIVVATVSVTFVGTRWAGRRLGLSSGMSLLVATGFSICGASAIAAVEGVADAREEEVAFAVALVTLCGTLAIFVLPPVGHAVGLDGAAYGSWVGASVHDIGQVVAAAAPGGAVAVQSAVIVKLTRVMLLAPLVATLTAAKRRRERSTFIASGDGRRPSPVPAFVAGFLAAIVLRTIDVLPDSALTTIKSAQTVLLAAALFGLGCGVHIAKLRLIGQKPLLLGSVSWVLVAAVAYGTTRAFAA
jgi:uncharacterized integral membrane protein (TIGR00698 family)